MRRIVNAPLTRAFRRLCSIRRLRSATDVVVWASIAFVTALQFFAYEHAPDCLGDATYVELAKSLLERHAYVMGSMPEVLIPPGFPAILALASFLFGETHAVLLRVTGVLSGLGILCVYEWLRRVEGRAAAAAITLLMASSPVFFTFATRLAFSDLPFLFFSMLVLLSAGRLASAKLGRSCWLNALLLSAALTVCLAVRTAALAMILGLIAWLLFSCCRDWRIGRARAIRFLPVVLCPLIFQLLWTAWIGKHPLHDWPLPGYPGTYVSQIELKSGNEPTLGEATLADIPPRITAQLADHAIAISELLLRRKWLQTSWFSPFVLGAIAIVAFGVGWSIFADTGSFEPYYFICYEFMYLIWPWRLEIRFILPIVPLACLYFWRGARILPHYIRLKPVGVAAVALVISVPPLFFSIRSAAAGRLETRAFALFWIVSVLASFVLMGKNLRVRLRAGRVSAAWTASQPFFRISGSLVIFGLVLIGFGGQIRLASQNLHFQPSKDAYFPDMEAGEWLHLHVCKDAVVMAQKFDIVLYYSHRDVRWFPPVDNGKFLMSGIRRLGISYVVVADKSDGYFSPPEQECFASLLRTYPADFRLVHHGPGNHIYQVIGAKSDRDSNCSGVTSPGNNVHKIAHRTTISRPVRVIARASSSA